MANKNSTPLNITAGQYVKTPGKEQWSTPKVEVFDKAITESGDFPQVEAVSILGIFTS